MKYFIRLCKTGKFMDTGLLAKDTGIFIVITQEMHKARLFDSRADAYMVARICKGHNACPIRMNTATALLQEIQEYRRRIDEPYL